MSASRLALAVLIVGLGLAAETALAQEPEQADVPAEPLVSPGEPFYEQAREAYRRRTYDEALNLLTQAIQADPDDPRYYIGAARAANFAGQLDTSVLLYDAYIAAFPAHAEEARRRADRLEAIQRERDEANRRREAPDTPVTLPEAQASALAALEQRLTSGPYMTSDGSGAYTIYQALLRAGYAMPALRELRRRLVNGLLTETQNLFWPTADSPVAIGDLARWQSIPDRYRVVEELGRPVLTEPRVQARILAARARVALFNANLSQAIDDFGQAAELDPDLLMAHIGLLTSLHRHNATLGCCHPLDPEPSLERVALLIELQAPQHRSVVPLLRGMVESDRGDATAGARRLVALLAPEVGLPAAEPTPEAPAPPPALGAPAVEEPQPPAEGHETAPEGAPPVGSPPPEL